jgi:hypothetical protein
MQPASNLGGCGHRRTLGTSQGHQHQREVERKQDVMIGLPSRCGTQQSRVRSQGCCAS